MSRAASRWAPPDTETWFKISVPAAKSGIAAGIVLGIGRAIGEAMAVMMVAGNSPNMPDSLFRSVTFLTTAIAKEMSYASGLQKQALFSIALVLFVFIMGINVVLNADPEGRRSAMNADLSPARRAWNTLLHRRRLGRAPSSSWLWWRASSGWCWCGASPTSAGSS